MPKFTINDTFYKRNPQKKLDNLNTELEQYNSIFSEEVATETLVHNNSLGAPKVGLFEEVINYFLVY